MPRDDDKSLGDEATLQGGKETPADERSLGDRSTFGGGEGSSVSDLGEFADLPDHDMEIVDLSSRYKIEESLGKGGMGEVFLATDTRLDRKVAIKRIRGDAGSSKAAVARFLTEAKSVAALSHNNVVQVYDYGRDKEGPFLIMEYVPGGSLLDRCKQGPMELEEAIDLACQLCDGLGRAHDAGIIHRDIKPANILLTDDNIPKLTDFGLAKAESRDHTMTMAGAVLGTLDFMPPEQRQDISLVDARSDLWSLAATLYQMVTGESPRVIDLDEVPSELRKCIAQALKTKQGDRYQNASELRDALKQSLQGGTPTNVELEQGECPNCGTKNDSSRKFCRNTACAASLEVTCLSCSEKIPIWEGVCGECGSIQTDLLNQCREDMGDQKLEAESCLAGHDYTRATELAREIGNEADPRLQQLKNWSDEFTEQVESTRLAEIGKVEQAIAEALSHEQAHDYSSGIKAFAQIPDSILAGQDLPEIENARDVLARLQEKQSSAETLQEEIKSRIKAKNLSGLLLQVESLLELLPERADLLKLQQQLQKRDSDLEKARVKTLAAAEASMQQHDYAGVLSLIEKLNAEKIDKELSELQSLAKAREARSQELAGQIRQEVSNQKYDGLLALIDEYLTLKAHDADALKSRDELIAREKREQAEAAALLARQREEAKKKRAAAKELAAKQRARKLKIIVSSSIAAAFVLMLSVMLYLRSQRIARDISEALDRGHYAAALELDPGNELFIALMRRDYQTALRLDPGNAQASAMKQKAIEVANALANGDYRKALQLDPANAAAREMKKAADVEQALFGGDYATALLLDPNNDVARAMKKAADIEQALSGGDYATALLLDPNNDVALSMKKADIQQALSGGDYATALLLDPNNDVALAMKKADIQQALSEGDYTAALLLDPANATARKGLLQMPLITNSIGMKIKSIPPGRLQMGGNSGHREELPPHEFTISMPYQLGIYEVTQEQYARVMGNNPSRFKSQVNPVEKVTWDDALRFCEKLSALPEERAAGRVYRLPTEAEWEYACRGAKPGNQGPLDEPNDVLHYAWFKHNSQQQTHPVGEKNSNDLGMYDMYGNVWEWCEEHHQEAFSHAIPGETETSLQNDGGRVVRGGSWFDPMYYISVRDRRVFNATICSDGIGFRVALSSSGK